MRPIWAPAWSTLTESPTTATTVRDNIQITVFYSGDGDAQPLPGVSVIATPTGDAKLAAWRVVESVTDPSGRAILSLPPGVWKIRAELVGLVPVKQTLSVANGVSYDIKMYTTFLHSEPVTVF